MTRPAKRLKVTLIAHELGANMMRTRSIAAILLRKHDVELVTCTWPDQGIRGDCVEDLPVTSHHIVAESYPGFLRTLRRLREVITGDVLYALKLRPTSFGVALLERLGGDRPVLLDVDDWEPYMCYPYSKYWPKNVLLSLPQLRDPNSFIHTWLIERLARRADNVTSVSRFFQRRFGGVLLPNGCDTALFDPRHFDREALRREWGVADSKVAMFVGTADPHKGVGKVARALELLGRPDVKLVILGWRTPYVDELRRRGNVLYWGMHPPEAVPQFLSMADVVVLPQADLPFSTGQMPMKLFEAMAMAVPVISTPMADIAGVLDGCGLVSPSDAPEHLAEQIEWVLAHPEASRELGRAARERVERSYGWNAMERILDGVMAPFSHTETIPAETRPAQPVRI